MSAATDTFETAVRGLTISRLRLDVATHGHDIVDDFDLTIAPGTITAVVGESGSGKTTVGLAVLGHARKGVQIANGSVHVGDLSVLELSADALRNIRGSRVSYVPQDPSSSLNPALRIGVQLREVLEAHNFGASDGERAERVKEMMAEVLLPADDAYLARYPHQLSGGQQQRVGLAMAFACRPDVIVLDEPTTGLDVSTQAHVLESIRELTKVHHVAALYITHDLAVVADLADHVAVMYGGRIVEYSSTRSIFTAPQHPYTRHLVAAAPDIASAQAITGIDGRAPAPGRRPTGCFFADRCELADDDCRASQPALHSVGEDHQVRCIHAGPTDMAVATRPPVSVDAAHATVLELDHVNAGYNRNQVVHEVSFTIGRGECVALVGESGSGKTTLSRSVGGLHKEWSGTIALHGDALAHGARSRTAAQRMQIQYVFQNPYASLNPRRSIGDSVMRPLLIAGRPESEARAAMYEMLERVALTAGYAEQYPNQLSGGERQRVAIARALVSRPDLLVCDEVTSALDVLVQAAIVKLLGGLQRELGLSMLFVTHNLPLVRSIADRVVVLHNGRAVEQGSAESVIGAPQQEYTRRLIADTPSIQEALAR